ncbi:MAG: hypothetical protein D3917_05060 [Candidatus Electrothrix sp. AX5]|nr:hypothetical protein [Candidatus Electrothrix sp. AX5]
MGEILSFVGFLLFVIAVIVHLLLKKKYFSASSDKKKDLLFRINVITSILLTFYFVLTLYAFLDGLRYPNVGSLCIIILLFTCPGLLVQLSLLMYSLSKKRLPSRFFLRRILLTITGIVMAVSVMKTSGYVAMRRFVAATEPLVQYVKKSMPAPCEPVYTYLQTNRPNTYFNMSDLYYNDHEFLLLYRGGSIDIDGSTVYFHSKHSKWEIMHNDDPDIPSIYLIGDALKSCEAFRLNPQNIVF